MKQKKYICHGMDKEPEVFLNELKEEKIEMNHKLGKMFEIT